MSFHRQIFGQKYGGNPNTFIGGMAATFPTSLSFADFLQISQDRIQDYKISGSDIECRIIGNYELNNGWGITFTGNSNITYFRNIGGNLTSVGGVVFSNTPNFILFETDYPTILGTSNFQNSAIQTLIANYSTALGTTNLQNCTQLTSLQMSSLTTLSLNSISGCNSLTHISSPLVSIQGLANLSSLISINFDNLTSTNGAVFNNTPSVVSTNIPLLEGVANKNAWFNGGTSFELISMKKLKIFGDPSVRGTNVFNNLKAGCLIQVHEDLATANSGNADAALVWVKANRSATVEFYDSFGNYVSTL